MFLAYVFASGSLTCLACAQPDLQWWGMTPSLGLCRSGYGAGRPLWPQWVTSRFRDLCDAAGLPRIGPHGFRHSAATLRFTSGASPKLVSQRIGHASPTVTLTLLARAARPRRGGGRAFAAALADAAKAQSQSECDHDVTMQRDVIRETPGQGHYRRVRRQGLEPRTRGLRVVWPRAPSALPARMPPASAVIALIAPVSAGDPVHEPVHDLLRPPANANYATLLRAPKADAAGSCYATLTISMYGHLS